MILVRRTILAATVLMLVALAIQVGTRRAVAGGGGRRGRARGRASLGYACRRRIRFLLLHRSGGRVRRGPRDPGRAARATRSASSRGPGLCSGWLGAGGRWRRRANVRTRSVARHGGRMEIWRRASPASRRAGARRARGVEHVSAGTPDSWRNGGSAGRDAPGREPNLSVSDRSADERRSGGRLLDRRAGARRPA